MSFDTETLYRLLPAIHRIRDTEIAAGLPELLTPDETSELKALDAIANPNQEQQARKEVLREKAARGPLKSLLAVFAEQVGVMEENLAQLYDDLFVETSDDWVIPYIGDLIGYLPLHPLGNRRRLERAEVAHTIALRRRKGTAAVLEQLARDVTGWNARAVEFFQLLATTQHMNHVRPSNYYSPNVRRWEPLSRIGSAFDSVAHTVDVRRIESGHGKYNIPNVGIFLWRLNDYRHNRSPAIGLDDRRWFISSLGQPLQLFHHPRPEDEITHIAEPINVSEPISRRMLDAHLDWYYGTQKSPTEPVDNVDPSIVIFVDGKEVPRSLIVSCDLSDDGSNWLHRPKVGHYAIDPLLGRIALAPDLPVPKGVDVTYHRGFSADMGGGEYPRAKSERPAKLLRVPNDHPTIQAAVNKLKGEGTILITDSGRYDAAITVNVSPGRRVMLCAADEQFPTLVLPAGGEVSVSGNTDSEFVLDGVMLTARQAPKPSATDPLRLIHVPATSGPVKLTIQHCTLVPGRTLHVAGNPLFPSAAAIQVEAAGIELVIQRAIVGALHLHPTTHLSATDSILDGTAPDRDAVVGMNGNGPCGTVALDACTVIGKLHAHAVDTISNTVLFARSAPGDADPPVRIDRKQIGCVRFSYLPLDSRVPVRFHCQPDAATDRFVTPNFVSQRFGVASYCQMAISTPDKIRRGADDESEMGAFHHLYPAQREANLRIRLKEFLRVGLEAGVLYET